jgi:large subunit ribosomal protein L21e
MAVRGFRMVKRSKGIRSKSRQILRKAPRERGMTPITHLLRDFPVGTRVAVVVDPSSQKGMPHLRFQGYTGLVAGRRGDAYLVNVNVGGKMKTVIARPQHLKTVA